MVKNDLHKKVTVVLPTYNRSECVAYYLENAVAKYSGDFFVFEIHDSSTDDSTKNIVDGFNGADHVNKINYHRYSASISADDKVQICLVNAKTDYVYLIGDGILPNFEKLESFLIQNNYSDYDIIGVLAPHFKYNDHNKTKYLNFDTIYKESDKDNLIINHLVCFTLYGATIIKNRIITNSNKQGWFAKYKFKDRISYFYSMSLFESIKSNNYNVGVSFLSFWRENPKKKGNWAHDEYFYQVFYVAFIESVDKLPFSKGVKAQALKNVALYHFNFASIFRYRLNNVFTVKLLKKYKPYVKRMNNHYWFMWFVAFIPKWVIYIFYLPLKYTKRGIKKLLKKD